MAVLFHRKLILSFMKAIIYMVILLRDSSLYLIYVV